MVYLLCRCDLTGVATFLAERVRRDIAVADSAPRPPVSFVDGGVAPVPLIVPRVLLGMSRTKPGAGQFRASRFSTGILGFIRHRREPPFRAKEKDAPGWERPRVVFDGISIA